MTALPDPNDPIVLADGTKIDPANGKVIKEKKFIEVPNRSTAQEMVVKSKLRLSDIPAQPAQANAMSVVLAYTMMGLSDFDIGQVTQLTEAQVAQLRTSDVYNMFKEQMIANVIDQDKDTVRGMLQQHAGIAAAKIVELAEDADDEKVQLQASNSILDRTGNRPADVVHHIHQHQHDDLRIVHINRDERQQVPNIVIDAEVNDGNSS